MVAFYISTTSKIDDDLTDYGGLLHVLPLTVHLNWVDGPQHFSVSPSPLGTYLGFELGWTRLALGLGLGGLGPGLDNIFR